MALKLTNTLSHQKESFTPIKDDFVGIYTCGPTVYNYAHLGNLRAYVFADVLRRVLQMNNYKTKQVINITDVGHLASDQDQGEDKLEKGAEREGKTVWEVAKYYTEAFFEDLKKLNIIPADFYPRATDTIPEMIKLIATLEKKGYTYVAGGNVYFNTEKFKDYGKMAKLDLSADAAQSRVEQDLNKKNPFDFVLWFTNYKYKNHAMQWESPWGKGFPGWHIECSAMAMKFLGDRVDIHTGGIDHVPVHHTNEIAQSEAALGHKWVNFWLHNEFLNIRDGEKMAKSSGEFLRLQTLIDKGYNPLDYRYYLLGGHYRSPMQFSYEALDHAKNSLERAKTKINNLKNEVNEANVSPKEGGSEELKNEFVKALNDDLNTSKALSVLWKTLDSSLSAGKKLALIDFYDSILGLGLLEEDKIIIPQEIEKLAQERSDLRKSGDWKKADEIREDILKRGYDIEDVRDGFKISKR